MSDKIQKQLLDLVTEDYQQIVDMCADNQVGMPISNRSVTHAGILTRAIFRNATDKVEIFSGSLNEFFWQDIEKDIEKALEKNPALQVEIILAHANHLNEPANRLKLAGVHFFKVKEKFVKHPHFCVSGNMYRLEDEHEPDQNFSKNLEVHATANFNSPRTATLLKDWFPKMLAEEI